MFCVDLPSTTEPVETETNTPSYAIQDLQCVLVAQKYGLASRYGHV